MSDNQSYDHFVRFLNEKHDFVKTRLDGMIQALVTENHEEKIKANIVLLEACEDLSRGMATVDRPKWLESIIEAAKNYSNQHKVTGSNYKMMSNIMRQLDNVHNQTWSFDQPNAEIKFKFDDLYDRFKADSTLPKLFDALIETLDKMISCGDIDSLSALRSLEQLIAVIKQNKAGSYFSVLASWEFISSFMNNLLWQELGNVPGVKQLKSAFEKTAKDMGIELDLMRKSMAEEMSKKYNDTISALTCKQDSNSLLEHKKADQ
jgi:hypothetical protein